MEIPLSACRDPLWPLDVHACDVSKHWTRSPKTERTVEKLNEFLHLCYIDLGNWLVHIIILLDFSTLTTALILYSLKCPRQSDLEMQATVLSYSIEHHDTNGIIWSHDDLPLEYLHSRVQCREKMTGFLILVKRVVIDFQHRL